VVDVGRNDHPSTGHLFAHQRFGQVLALGHMGHFFGHHPLAGVVHLRQVGLTFPLFDPGAAHGGAPQGEGVPPHDLHFPVPVDAGQVRRV